MATRTWVLGDLLSASNINTYLQQNDAWTSYTPTLGNCTLGSGSRVGYYCQIGKVCHFYITVVFGAGLAVSGQLQASLPVTAARANQYNLYGAFLDSGSTYYQAMPGWFDTSTLFLDAVLASGTYAARQTTSSTIPFTWAANDAFYLGGTYETA